MNENILREKHFMLSPPQRKYPNNNILYKNYMTNRNNLIQKNNNIEGFENINVTSNDNSYSNFQKTMRYNNILNKLNSFNDEKGINNNINNFIESIKHENLSLKAIVKKLKKELVQRDNEIDIFKIKVKALLGQVQDKNNDLNKKRDLIIKLNEEKEINSMSPIQNTSNNNTNQTNYNLIKKQLDIANREKEKLIKDKKYLEKIIQKFQNLSKKNYLSPFQNIENEKSNDFNYKNNKIYNNNNSNYLIINSFYFSIEGEKNEEDDLLLERELQIEKLNKMIEELKKSMDFKLNKYKVLIEQNNDNKKKSDKILKNKEKTINDLSKDIKALQEENNLLKNELNEKINEMNEFNIKNSVLNNTEKDDLSTNNQQIRNFENEISELKNELVEKIKEIEDLKSQFINKDNEKINLERKIDELNEDNENLKEINEGNKKELNEKNNVINDLTKDNNKLYSDNTNLKNKLNIVNENLDNLKEEIEKEKNKNVQMTNDKKELLDRIIISQKEIENIKKENSDLTEQIKKYQNQNNEKNSILNTIKRQSKLNRENINIIKENIEDSKTENTNENNNKENKENINTNNDELKKENEVLQQKIIQLNEYNEDLNNQLNNINIKYKELKIENNNLKEVSHALLEKQKNDLEQKDKNEYISPETHFIILKKSYKKLNWYLISTVNPKSKNENDMNKYENYKWVTGLIIPKTLLNKYNKFEDEKEIHDLNSYNKKLKEKEDLISEKDQEIVKLSNQLQNKTASMNLKGGVFLLNKLNDKNYNINKSNSNQNYTNKFNANSCLGGEPGGDIEKYKNLLDRLNEYGEREIKYQNEISKLRNQIKNNQNLQSGLNNIKDISQHFLESEFIEDDKEEKNVIDLLSDFKKNEKKENKRIKDDDNFLNILNDVPGNESDLDEVKGLKKLITYLKDEIKEKDKILNELIEQIKELFKELKWNTKNNQRVSQILKILGYTPEIIKIIVDNKKGYNFDFNLKLKK